MHHFGYGCCDPCGYGYGVAPTYTAPVANNNGFILLVVLFILLIIVGGTYYTAC